MTPTMQLTQRAAHGKQRLVHLLAFLTCLLSLVPTSAHALMAGAAPDSPTARIDPATPRSPWSGVVAIKVGGGVYSGVLLADRYVLTAAHVAASAAATPQNLQAVFNLGAGAVSVAASHIDVFPSFSFPYDDLALVQLVADAPAEAVRYAVQDKLIDHSHVIRLVGYGASGNGDVGVSTGGNDATRRTGENVVDALVANVDSSGRSSAFYLYDFDGPTGNGAMGGPTLGNERETMVAPSDSGSPAFVTEGSRAIVMGINTFAAPMGGGTALTYTFGQGGGGMRLSDPRFISWLRTSSNNDIRMASDPVRTSLVLPASLAAGAGLLGGGLIVVLRKRRGKPARA